MKVVGDLLEEKGRDVFFVSPDATVHQAARVMSERNVGAVLVCSGGTLVGMLTERDCLRRVIMQGRAPQETLVAIVMTTTVTTVSPQDSVARCMHRMTHGRIRHLPVIDDEHVIGIISIGDVVKTMLAEQEQLISGLESYIHGHTASAHPPPL